MTFPLPQGICRKVCRPVRDPPRVVRANEVFRIARAAARNGEFPCAILSAAYQAVPQLNYPRRLSDVSKALVAAVEEVNRLTGAALEAALDLQGGRILLPWRVLTLLYRLYELFDALNQLSDAQIDSVKLMNEILRCLITRAEV